MSNTGKRKNPSNKSVHKKLIVKLATKTPLKTDSALLKVRHVSQPHARMEGNVQRKESRLIALVFPDLKENDVKKRVNLIRSVISIQMCLIA